MPETLLLRQGTDSDGGWLYQLYCTTMRVYIEKTWGWDETFQRNGFKSNLSPDRFKIIVCNKKDAGAFLVNEEEGYFWIEMILIHPAMQRRGIGTQIIKMLQTKSQNHQKALKLSVIRLNPAIHFYRRLGFVVYEEDDAFIKMQWVKNYPSNPIL